MDSAEAVADVFRAQRARRWAVAGTGPDERVARLSRLKTALIRRRGDLLAGAFPRDEFAGLQGGGELGDRLLEQPFDHICFTGSQAVGRKIMIAAARHLASVTLELGGKSPAILDPSFAVAAAARRIA